MRSVLGAYYGAKSQIAEKILPHFPKGPETYVETCFGSGALFFALPEGLYPNRVINDLNRGVVTFFKVLRERPEELRRVCELTPYAFDEQRSCRDWTKTRKTSWSSHAGFGFGRPRISRGCSKLLKASAVEPPKAP
jgi:site-specific DNA-adenine methylase